jgi:hypothetical protein
MVLEFNGDFYIDHTHAFGARPASSNAGQIANAIIDIMEMAGRSVHQVTGDNGRSTSVTYSNIVDPKYEDDICSLLRPNPAGHHLSPCGRFRYLLDRLEVERLAFSPTDTPLSSKKCGLSFEYVMVHIGFLWDLLLRRVSLPETKRLKYLRLLQEFLALAFFTLEQIQQVHGILVHVCFVYEDGSSRLPPISNFMSTFNGNSFSRRRPSNSLRDTLQWWEKRLNDSTAYREIRPIQPSPDIVGTL